MGVIDARWEFLNYFKDKGHKIYPSAPLVPNDASLLFTNAGMVQFKDIFTGNALVPTPPIASSAQLCIRAGGKHNDLENVGYTSRHHTLFEMLGNFSFGDYFKEEAISYAYEFVTKNLALPKDKLYISVHTSDDEAFNIWSKIVDKNKIKRFGDKDNFWQMGDTGPCGPCSEIFLDQGSKHFSSKEDYFGGEGDRFLEIWNLVFMQFERSSNGELKRLEKPSIDTGMGLERVQAILEGQVSNFSSSIFMPLIKQIESICNKEYIYSSGASFRVIADHARAICFLLAQGISFDKEGRGYVARRILRRALRHGYLLGIKEAFLYKVISQVISQMGGYYSYLNEQKDSILLACKDEEQRFLDTLESGMGIFKKELELTSGDTFSPSVAFKLYDTFGFPLDLTQDMLRDYNKQVDIDGFNSLMQDQKQRSKLSWKGSGDALVQGDFKVLLEEFGENIFSGYEKKEDKSIILSLLDSNFKIVKSLEASQEGYILMSSTPFYPESGGAIGDKGELYLDSKKIADVLETKKHFGLNISKIKALKPLASKLEVESRVWDLQDEVRKHHSATHLLQATLRKFLGNNVSQAGSHVEDSYLRFDFTYNKALSKQELEQVELYINSLIFKAIPFSSKIMQLEDAIKLGAMALFSQKYQDDVRVVSFSDESIELCGGLHVSNTIEIGSFFIVKQGSVSSGVRRIEAVCGRSAYKYSRQKLEVLSSIEEELKSTDILKAILKLKQKPQKIKDSNTLESTCQNGIHICISNYDGDLKNQVDMLRNKFPKVFIFLVSKSQDRLNLALACKGITLDLNTLVKALSDLGLKGGGRKDFILAGVKPLPEEINSVQDKLLSRAREFACSLKEI